MKLLFVINSLPHGGAEQALVNLLPELRRRGYCCAVAALQPPYHLAAPLEDAGVAVHRLNLRHRYSMVEAVLPLGRLGRQFDVLHAHLFFAAIYTALSKVLAPQPRRVVSFHNLDYDLHPPVMGWPKVRRAAHTWLLREWIDGRSAVSQAVAEHYAKHLKLRDITVIPNAFSVDRIQPLTRHRRDAILAPYYALHDFVVVVPARLAPEKGHRFLLQALHILRGRNLLPRVLLLGDGPQRAAIESEVAYRGLQKQVTLLHAVPHAHLMALVQAADALALPSTHEGLPLVVGEAMALRCPVLVTDVGGLRDLVENGVSGLMVPPGDPLALADGLACLMQDSGLRRRLGAAGRQVVSARFSVERVAELWDAFYREL